MKKYLSILAIILLCAFLFVSCDDLDLEALGGIIGGLTGEILSGDAEEAPDYSNPGGATAEADIAGTWTGSSTTFDENFNLIDSAVIVTIGGGKFTISEQDMSGNDLYNPREGDFVLGENLLVMDLSKKPADPDNEKKVGYILIVDDGSKKAIKDFADEESFSDPETKFSDLTEDGSDLIEGYDFTAFGEMSKYETRYSNELLSGSAFTIETINSDLTEDGKITLSVREKKVSTTVEVLNPESKEENEYLRVKYTEGDLLSEQVSYWYRYTKETDTLEIHYGGELLKLTRNK